MFTLLVGTNHRSASRAPEFSGRGWLNTGGAEPRPESLRGRPTLLVFWTSSCAGALSALRPAAALQRRFGAHLSVLTVHSPKFEHQTLRSALRAAIERESVELPVLDDVELATWAAYGITAWPSFVLLDAEGDVAAHMAGASHLALLPGLIATLVGANGAGPPDGWTDPGPAGTPPGQLHGRATPLRFPGKLVRLPSRRPLAHPAWAGALLTADSAHGQLVVLDDDLVTELGRIGTGIPGIADGGPGTARFVSPHGMTVLPAPVAADVGYDVVVADSGAHALRGVRLADGSVRTLAAGMAPMPAGGASAVMGPSEGAVLRGPDVEGAGLPTPRDVVWFDGFVAVAMAGLHQLWAFVPAVEPADERLVVLAGGGTEGILDGPATKAWFAQPSGLAVAPDGATLWVADAMSSSLRWLRHSIVGGYEVGTAVGQGLWRFGWRDGRRGEAMFQHPLGVTALHDGAVAVADTYNGAVRRYDPVTGEVSTLAVDLDEPGDVLADGDAVLIAESGAHRLLRVPAVPVHGGRVVTMVPSSRRPPVELAPGPVTVHVRFGPPAGHALDDRYGAPTWLALQVEPPDLLVSGPGAGPGLDRELVVPEPADGSAVDGTLHIAVHAATRAADPEESDETAEYVQDWGIPIRLAPGGAHALTLDLSRPSRHA